MKYHFIVNPAAGKGRLADTVAEKIRNSAKAIGRDVEIYYTAGVGDATEYVKRHTDGEAHAFFACGGDGTLCEVANGIMALDNRDNIYLGTVPSGTGNDFVRNFTNSENFMDIDAQLDASSMEIDLIGCNDMYAVNMINIGFDCEVVVKKAELQKSKIFPAKLAYVAGLAITLARKPGVKCRISFDGGEPEEYDLLLTTYANGEFCGGGFHSNPSSAVNNGKINALTVNNISRSRFITIVGRYKKGTHLSLTDILSERNAERVCFEFEGDTNISVDGEVVKVSSLTLNVVKNAVKFLLPEGCEYKKTALVLETAAV